MGVDLEIMVIKGYSKLPISPQPLVHDQVLLSVTTNNPSFFWGAVSDGYSQHILSTVESLNLRKYIRIWDIGLSTGMFIIDQDTHCTRL